MLTTEQHLDNLVRHIELVREAGLLLGKRLMAQGRKDFGRILIGKCFEHDVSKFYGIEWKYLHAGKDIAKEKLAEAVEQHTLTNDHHPEFHGGFDNMPEMAIAEMSCDLYARAQEFGTNLRDWIRDVAVDKYKIDIEGDPYKMLMKFVDLLLEDHFVR